MKNGDSTRNGQYQAGMTLYHSTFGTEDGIAKNININSVIANIPGM